jgi:hypothetical protein
MEKLRKSTLVGLGALLAIVAVWLGSQWQGQGNTEPETRRGEENMEDRVTVQKAGPPFQNQNVGTGRGEEGSEGVMGSVYGEIPSASIQISEETKDSSQASNGQGGGSSQEKATIPSGFGLKGENGDAAGTAAVSLETPFETPKTPENKTAGASTATGESEKGIEAIDPREIGINTNDGPEANYEETVLTVQRTLTAVTASGDKQLIRLKIPVLYKSRSLRLQGKSLEEANKVLADLRKKRDELAKIKEELEVILKNWNAVVTEATPHEVLLPESPTLPANQSSGKINREGDPSMSAGKAITYEIINKEGNKP